MADYRVIKRPITDDEWLWGKAQVDNVTMFRASPVFVAQRKTWRGWRNINVDNRKNAIYGTLEAAESAIKIYVAKLLEPEKKGVDVVSEFRYNGPTRAERFFGETRWEVTRAFTMKVNRLSRMASYAGTTPTLRARLTPFAGKWDGLTPRLRMILWANGLPVQIQGIDNGQVLGYL